jgi:hypothetical protein
MTEERGMFGSLENVLREEDPELAVLIGTAYTLYKQRNPGKEDPPLPVVEKIIVYEKPVPDYPRQEAQQSPLDKAMDEYRKAWNNDELTPALINTTWKEFWANMSKSINLPNLTIPLCDRSEKELAELRGDSRMVILMPDEFIGVGLSTPLIDMFITDKNRPRSRPIKRIFRQSKLGGCVDVEMNAEPPYVNQSAEQVLKQFTHDSLAGSRQNIIQGQRMPTYLVASIFKKLWSGEFFDERTETSLLGSRTIASGNPPVQVTVRDGYLSLTKGSLRGKNPNVGFRSERRKRSAT